MYEEIEARISVTYVLTSAALLDEVQPILSKIEPWPDRGCPVL